MKLIKCCMSILPYKMAVHLSRPVKPPLVGALEFASEQPLFWNLGPSTTLRSQYGVD